MHSPWATHCEYKHQQATCHIPFALGRRRQLSWHGSSSIFPVRAGVSAGQSKYTMTPPKAAISQWCLHHRRRRVGTAVQEPPASKHGLCLTAQVAAVAPRVARRKAPCMRLRAPRRRGVPRLLFPWRQAGGKALRVQGHATRRSSRVPPNPSFKPSPNGMPPGPGHRYGVHFLWPGPGVMPSVPA